MSENENIGFVLAVMGLIYMKVGVDRSASMFIIYGAALLGRSMKFLDLKELPKQFKPPILDVD